MHKACAPLRSLPIALTASTLATILFCTVLGTPLFAQGGSPCAPLADGSLTTFDSGDVSSIDAALFTDGSGIAAWSATGDGSRAAIFGQRINADGTAQGQPFLINTLTTEDQFEPAIAAASNGRYVAVWTSDISPGDNEGTSIRGRAYLANGTPVGADFQVNGSIFGPQRTPDVAMATDGSFTVVWYDDSDSPGSSQMNGREVRARRFNANGAPLGPDFIVNNLTNGTQDSPAIAMDPTGRFVVAFSTSSGSPGNDTNRSVQARLYAANGTPTAGQFQVNTTIEGVQTEPAIAMDPDGSFLVVWKSASSPGTDQDSNSIQARGYTKTGAAVGPQKQVNEVVASNQFTPQVAAAGAREFLVVWHSRAVDDRVKARALTLEVETLGVEFRAGGFSNETTSHPAVGGSGTGRTVILFERSQEVRSQSYDLPCVNSGGNTNCIETNTNLCLNSDRFRISAVWTTPGGDTGQGQAVELTPDTGYFWFFDSANVEAVAKMINACSFNDRFWVFIGGLTDLKVEFMVEDVETGVIRRYENPQQTSFLTVNDTDAFDTCP